MTLDVQGVYRAMCGRSGHLGWVHRHEARPAGQPRELMMPHREALMPRRDRAAFARKTRAPEGGGPNKIHHSASPVPSVATAAPSPDVPPPARLLDLPRELLERALSRCDSPVDIARVAAVSLLFHASLAEQGIRLWAQERGFELPAEGCGSG